MSDYRKDSYNSNNDDFFNDIYDDFWSDALKLAAEKIKQIKYNKEHAGKINFKTREEYLKDAEEREKRQTKTISSESSGYFDEYDEKEKKPIPKIEVKEKPAPEVEEEKELTEEEKQTFLAEKKEKLAEFFSRIDEAHLTDDSKTVLKKMIDYARKFEANLVKKYIPFNMRLYASDNESLYSIVNIIIDSFTYYGYIKNDEAVERSLYIVDEPNHITDLYNANNSLVIFKDIDGVLNRDKITRDKLLNVLETTIIDYSGQDGITTIIVDKTKEKVNSLLDSNITLRDKIFDFELTTKSANIQEIYQSILLALKNDYTVTDTFEVKLLDYITETSNKSSITPSEYTNALIEKILFNQTSDIIDESTIPEYDRNKSIDEIFEELNSLVGLDNVKEMLHDLVSLIEFKNKAGDQIKVKDTNLHMVFLGNPGTGKTTVARMVAGILYNLKYIEQNKLIEVSAKDLIGQYVGQTAPKTMEVIERALGGVLFIDEAYSLASASGGSGNSFNEECIATLIQAMENYRDHLVVIFAGYSKEMDAFLKSNSGIVSRIGYTMDFKDYTVDELIKILLSMFRKAGFSVSKEAVIKAQTIIEEYRQTEGFGNARFVRNLYEKAVIEHATNTEHTTSQKALKTITAKDITTKNLLKM